MHQEAKRFAREGYDILLVGHAGHEEVEGTSGEAPEHIQLVETAADAASVTVRDPDPHEVAFPPNATPALAVFRGDLVAYPTTWLLRVGWRRHGPIRVDAVPGGAS